MIKPMPYQCRAAGKSAFCDRKYPGTYNTRRDSLKGFWKPLFGQTDALMAADRFCENVETPMPCWSVRRTGEPMLIACTGPRRRLWLADIEHKSLHEPARFLASIGWRYWRRRARV